ncbi:hypothetical protein K523DRAFT_288526, partial [Schizophyllum commune Tattone D]
MPGIWGRIADAMVHILRHHGVDALIKWVDDFIFFRYPRQQAADGTFEYGYDASLVWALAKVLGWPWEEKKFTPPLPPSRSARLTRPTGMTYD